MPSRYLAFGWNTCELLLLLYRWRSWERQVRFVAVWGAFVALALFYIIPITAVQGLINVRAVLHSGIKSSVIAAEVNILLVAIQYITVTFAIWVCRVGQQCLTVL